MVGVSSIHISLTHAHHILYLYLHIQLSLLLYNRYYLVYRNL